MILKPCARSLIRFRNRCSRSIVSRFSSNRGTIGGLHELCRCRSFTSSAILRSLNTVTADDIRVRNYINSLKKAYEEAEERLKSDTKHQNSSYKNTFFALQPVIFLNDELEKYKQEEKELRSLITELKNQDGKDLLPAALEELKICEENIRKTEDAILTLLIPRDLTDEKDIIMELSAGVGGQEAMLFTKDMFDMYLKYASFKGWSSEIMKYDATELGGIRTGHIGISGGNVHQLLKFESGVHRVQRIPKTEKSGRIHTSTMTVAVLPQPKEIDIELRPKDLKTEFKNSSGAGGQNVNKNHTCVRLTHIPTGIAVECQVERMQYRNHEIALKSLKARLYQRELEKTISETRSSRKLQVGTAARSDKVRTYNFPQDRITDHRTHQSYYGISNIFEGGEKLDELLEDVKKWAENHLLCDILQKHVN